MRTSIFFALVTLTLATDARAATEVLTFDDLPTPGGGCCGIVPDGYGSLNWNNFDYQYAALDDPSGYLNGLVSGIHVAFNANANPAFITAVTPFNLDSVYMTGAWDDGLNVEIVGSRGGAVLYDQVFVVNTSAPTLLSLNYLSVDQVRFVSLFGTPNPNLFPGNTGAPIFAIDNLSVTLPEPALPAIAVFAALALALSRSRSEHVLAQ